MRKITKWYVLGGSLPKDWEKDDIGECQFEDESGNIGKFSLILNNKNEIEVKFEYVYEDVGQSI